MPGLTSVDLLLARAAALLGLQAKAEDVPNCGLLEALAAGELQGVLVCAAVPPALQGTAPADPSPAAADAQAEAVPGPAAMAAAADQEALPPAAEKVAAAQPADDLLPIAAMQQQPSLSLPSPSERTSLDAPHAVPALSVHAPAALPPELARAPAVYLSRSASDGGGALQGEALVAAVAATLLPSGPCLPALHQLLDLVVAPWLAAQQPHGSTESSGLVSSRAGAASAASTAPGDAASALGTARSAARGAGAGGPAGELLAATRRFAAQAVAAARHLRSEVQVQLPDGVDLSDVAAAAASEQAVAACERCMEEWVLLATKAVAREDAAQPAGRGPLPELEFWVARAEALGHLLEQFGAPAVRAVQAVVERGGADGALGAAFRAQMSELARLALEARDNARFLGTLERHFRAIHGGPLAAVADAVPPLLNALRMIWVISRYFGDDVHMSNLLERIAQVLQDRLDGALDIGALFRAPAADSLALVRTCEAVARGWQAHYLSNRERIEASGHHARWEFSKSLLFERTNHIAEVCAELGGMLEAVDDFRQFLGPELKAVTGDASVIEEVTVMVSAMVEPVEQVGFSPFDRARAADWHAVRARFARDADDVKLSIRDLVDTCFRKLRSVDAAAQLLHSFQKIQAQGAMRQQMADKLVAVLEHFTNEIASVRRLFEEGRETPPVTRNQPPLAGSIRWSRGLLARLRRTWLRLQALNAELESLEAGKRAAAALTDLSKEMLHYEKTRFAAWCSGVDAAVTAGLQQPLLARVSAGATAADGSSSDAAAAAGTPGPALRGGASGSPGAGAGGAAGDGASSRVAINFPAGLLLMTREAKYLDQLGLAVPPLAVNLALQEGQLREHFQVLGCMLERHAAASAPLRSADRALLSEQLAALEAALDPGLTRINWSSLTIPDFVAGVNKAVDQFTALVAQVHKNTGLIEKVLYQISRARLVPPDAPTSGSRSSGGTAAAAGAPAAAAPTAASAEPQQRGAAAPAGEPAPAPAEQPAAAAAGGAAAEPAEGAGAAAAAAPDVPTLQEFYEDFEQHRQQVVEGLAARYRTIGPLLTKVEELVAGSATGKAPRLAGYYAYWERRLFSAVCSMVVSGLQALTERMQACRAHGGAPREGGDADAPKPPLFRVALQLMAPEIVPAPSAVEVGRQLGRLMRNLVESARPFTRWMDGTCLEAPEQYIYGEDAEPFTFSFFADVSQSPAVIRAMLAAQHEVQRATAGVGRVAERWRVFGALWRTDRAAALVKLRARKPNVAAAEERMAQYHRVGEDAWAAGADHDAHFIRVRCAPLAAAVRSEAQAWVRGIGEALAEAEAPQREALRQQAATLLAGVQQEAEGEADVGRIHAAIVAAGAAAPGAAAALAELEERCRCRWSFVVPPDEAALAAELAALEELRSAWTALEAAAAERARAGVQPPKRAESPDAAAGEGSADASRRGSVLPGVRSRASGLMRTASSASTASTASTKGRRGPSRAGKERNNTSAASAGS